jgi:2-polyprenyl-6-methoxyphenol hydroxylase-like FAD-dependent oxidoreductase
MMPQARFLDFLATEARHYPNFHLLLGARVHQLIVENGTTKGVLYQSEDQVHEIRATLVVGADGRFSKVRQLAAIEPIQQGEVHRYE